MKRPVFALLGLALGTSVAMAEAVKPGDVKFAEGAVKASLTGVSGNPDEGRKIFVNRKLGNCLACHANEDLANEQFHGEVGPSLDGVASRWMKLSYVAF